MSTYVPKNSRVPYRKPNHEKFDTPEIKRRRVAMWIAIAILGPICLVSGLIGLWLLVAFIVVGVFKVLPLIKA